FDWEAQVDWDTLAPSLLPALLISPLSIDAFLIRRGRKEAYQQTFYVFFIAVTVVDCAVMLV
ncbi:hypothetical protein AAVH_17403, partial [Aphelenchoides avenae]